MNVTLLRKIQKNILAKPERLEMRSWIELPKGNRPMRPSCGTACCIGGWAMIEKGYKIKRSKDEGSWTDTFIDPKGEPLHGDEEYVAANLLKLDDIQRNQLFFSENWPEPFSDLAHSSRPEIRAANAVARIEHFIQTNGAE